jgi:electron transfer flavoprotein alpha subunit
MRLDKGCSTRRLTNRLSRAIPILIRQKMDNTNRKDAGILVLAEREGQAIAPITFELIGIGRKIANELSSILSVALLGHAISDVSGEIASFADEIFYLDHPLLADFEAELYGSALEQLCKSMNPSIVLMGHTLDNLSLAPKISYRFGVQVITDCIQLAIEPVSKSLLCSKPVYGGKVVSTFKLEKKPYIITVRPKTAEPAVQGRSYGQIIHFDTVNHLGRVELIDRIKEESISLNKAEVIVAGGRGIKGDEGLKLLKELIRALKKYSNRVELGGSRPLADARLIPSFRQIGLTGEKVAPSLYIAVGISGSLQHVTGTLGAKKIIAINNNPKAPIFGVADWGSNRQL